MQHLTMEDFERVLERAKNRPPRTPEEIKRSEEFAKKMRNLSSEERQAMRKKFMEEHPYL